MPLTYLPFSCSRKFVGRTQEVESLRRKLFLHRDWEKMAVVGLRGIGKTQTVLHFTYSVLDEYPDVSVLWVPVLSAETFERAYEEIATLVKIPCNTRGEDDMKELVRRHLSSREAGRWLMIVDIADDMSTLEGSARKEGVLPYLPESELGSTVFTTRDSR
jgi:Cdc6-like AAA superfamily ATPase